MVHRSHLPARSKQQSLAAMPMNNWRRNPTLVKLDLHDLPLWEWEVMVAWRSGKRVDASKQRVLDTVRAMAADWA